MKSVLVPITSKVASSNPVRKRGVLDENKHTEGTIKIEQSRDTSNIGHKTKKKTNKTKDTQHRKLIKEPTRTPPITKPGVNPGAREGFLFLLRYPPC